MLGKKIFAQISERVLNASPPEEAENINSVFKEIERACTDINILHLDKSQKDFLCVLLKNPLESIVGKLELNRSNAKKSIKQLQQQANWMMTYAKGMAFGNINPQKRNDTEDLMAILESMS